MLSHRLTLIPTLSQLDHHTGEDLSVMVNTTMNPWQWNESIEVIGRIFRTSVLNCMGKVRENRPLLSHSPTPDSYPCLHPHPTHFVTLCLQHHPTSNTHMPNNAYSSNIHNHLEFEAGQESESLLIVLLAISLIYARVPPLPPFDQAHGVQESCVPLIMSVRRA